MRIGIVGLGSSHIDHFMRFFGPAGALSARGSITALGLMDTPYADSFPDGPQERIEDLLAGQDRPVPFFYGTPDVVAHAMAPHVDVVIVGDRDSRSHADHALPFVSHGLPVFVDKPLAANESQAVALLDARLIGSHQPPAIQSFSALRYHPRTQCARERIQASARSGPPATATVSGPYTHSSPYGSDFYAVHAVEVGLALLLGPLETVTVMSRDTSGMTARLTTTHQGELQQVFIQILETDPNAYLAHTIQLQDEQPQRLDLGPDYLRPAMTQWLDSMDDHCAALTDQELLAPVRVLDALLGRARDSAPSGDCDSYQEC